MARIKKFAPEQKLSSFQTFIVDDNPNSDYFRITEFKDTFTGGKNGFLIEGSEYLKESTEIKIDILDVNGDPIYYEPGNGIPEYYEGISKLVAVYIYEDTPIGLGKITVLGELKQYDDNGVIRQIPPEWQGAYNVKWERTFQINKNLANEDKVRFYRRPRVTIDEIVKPIFSGNPPSVTQTGSVDGIPLVPNENINLSNFTLPTSYRLVFASGSKWTGSAEGQTITFDNISYSPTINDVVNETEIIVSPPYTENNIVKSFIDENYSLTFPYIEGVGDLATALTGSFAKISITDMKTFVGDAARVKVYRRSQSNLTDYEFVQEIQLESNELLRDIETFAKKEENYGIFTQDVLDSYWVTSSNDMVIQLNQDFLYNSVNLDSSPNNYFFTSQSFSVQSGVEYTLDLNVRKGANTSGDYLKVFLSGSTNGSSVSQTITTIDSSNTLLQKTNFNENIIADNIQTASLYFEVSGSDWYINNVSLKASQETSFSPDEITFIQQVPKTLVSETFDYRFEFYDINNNFIPVRVETTKTFVGGNTNLFNKSISITPDNLYFSFDSASNPANAVPPLIINFDVETTLITGSITYTSGAYDFFGNLIPEVSYSAGQYPGYLTDWDVDNGRQPFLRVQDFTGSRDDITVQFIRYTGEVEGVSDTFVITRVEDGKGGVSFEIVPFRGLQIKNKESKTLEVQAVRVDGINRIQLRDGLTRGWSEAKLHVLSSSLDGTQTYVSLSQAITNPNFLEGVSAGLTGSGEIDYNAIFTRDAIDNELTLYLMDGPTSESILTSVILTDLKDGLNNGIVNSTTEQFNIKYQPRQLSPFNPNQSIVTASFQRRGTTLNPLSASLVIYPSSSIEPKTELPHFYMFYETGAFDNTITVAVTDYLGNSISSGIPGGSVPYYSAVETKQLNLEFTYTEPITSASVTANKSFFITPDGLPGQNAIIIDIDPQPVALGSNHKGEVYNYSLANTDIQITQGDLFLINTASGDPGTFTTRSITPTNIQFTTLDGDSSTTMSLGGFVSMSALSASILYDFDIYPYFTASLVTASRTQKFTKVIEGGGAIEVTLDPIAVAFNADESGWISNYSLASTEVFIKQNDEFLLYDPTDAGTPGTFLTASISASGITFSEVSSSNRDLEVSGSGDEILHFKGFGGFVRTQPSASITYNFKVYPYSLTGGVAGVPRIVSKTQTFSKVNDGRAARKVSLVSSVDTVIYDGDGVKVAPVGSVILTATSYNTTGSSYYEFLDPEGNAIGAGSSTTATANVDNYLPGPGSSSLFTVNLRDGNPAGAIFDTDSVTVSGVQEGSTAYSAVLSNPASSVTVEVDGTTYFDNSGTLIRAYKGGTELQFVEFYDESAVDPVTFLPIGTFGQFSASIYDISSFLTHADGRIVSQSGQTYGSSSGVADWVLPQDNTQGYIIYKIDFENGRGTQFIQQSFSTVFEGATGPGIVFRGPYTGSIEYIYSLEQKRRDSVLYSANGLEPYDTYYATKESGSSYTIPAGTQPPTVGGVLNSDYWESLGQEEFFVAAKIAIFEESFVKNTINVGTPPAGNTNANIAIVGGTDEPYLAIGQTGTQGFRQPGVFIGMTNDYGGSGTAGTTGIMSLKSTPAGGTYKSLEWDGDTLTIRGAIRQTSAGLIEPALRGIWQDATDYNAGDLVTYNGQSWTADSAHTSDISGGVTDGPPGTGPWTAASGTGKTVTLGATSFVIAYDADGNNPSPSTINLIASSSNFVDPYFKFTGGGANFTDETSFTNGADGNYDSAGPITVPTTIFSTPLQFRVGVADGGLSGQDQTELISDTINVFAVKNGADVDPQYMITSIAGGTQIKNSTGTIELQVQKSDSTGLTDVTSGTDARIWDGGTLLAAQTGVTDGGNGVAYNPIIASSFINGSKTLTLKDGSNNVLDTITLVDVTDGLGGGSFISPNLKTNRNPISNTFTPSFLSATASFYDTSGTEYQGRVQITPSFSGGVDRMAVSAKAGDSEVTITAGDGDGGTITLGGSSVPTKDVVLTAVFTDPATSQTTTINETFYIVSDGQDGLGALTIILTNETHTVPADANGNVSSYQGSGTDIYLYEGTGSLVYDGVGTSNGTWKVVATGDNITAGSITDQGDFARVGVHNTMNEDSASVSYAITGKRVNGGDISITKIQSFVKGKTGASGSNGQDGTGAGVVYRGNYDSGEIYYHSAARRDVVLYAGTYYLANNEAKNGTSTWGTPPTDWETFGAEFESVSTDILFSQDVYANRTINIGTGQGGNPVIALNADSGSGYANPYISIGQNPTGFGEDGIFLGYSEGTASFSLLTAGAKANIGGLKVNKSGLYFTEEVVIGITPTAGSIVSASTYTFPNLVENGGVLTIGGNERYVSSKLTANSVSITSPLYSIAQTNWSLTYFSSSYQIAVGGPASPISGLYEKASWRQDFADKNDPASSEVWYVDWSIDLAATYTNLVVTNNAQGGSGEYSVVKTSGLNTEFSISDDDVNKWRGDSGGNILPSAPGGSSEAIDVRARASSEYPLVLYVESQNDGGGDLFFDTGSTNTRVGFHVLDIINSSDATSTSGYDSFVLGQSIHDQNLVFEDTVRFSQATIGVDTWADGQSYTTADPNRCSVWLNAQLQINDLVSVSSPGGTVTVGFQQEVSESIEIVRLHSSGSAGNNRPYLSMGQTTQSYDEDGIFIGYISGSDDGLLSLKGPAGALQWDGNSLIIDGRIEGGGLFGTGSIVEGSGIYVPSQNAPSFSVDINGNLTAESATVRGTIQATDGNIGDWVIDANTQALRDDNSEIVFEPNIPEIALYNENSKKVRLSPTGGLSPTDASAVTINVGGGTGSYAFLSTIPTVSSAAGTTSTQYGSYAYTNTSDTFVVSSAGTYPMNFTIGAGTLSSAGMSAVNDNVSYPIYNGSYEGQNHGSWTATRGSRIYQLVAELMWDDGGGYIPLESQTLVTMYAYSSYEYNDIYYWTNNPISVTGDTPIQLADGSTKLAEEIDGNDWLLVWDEQNNQLVPSQIGNKIERPVDFYFLVETETESVKVSDSHAFYLDGNVEKPVQELIAGEDEIYVYKDGILIKELVVNVTKVLVDSSDSVMVYTFTIPNYYNYISANILSHNPAFGTWELSANYETRAAQNGTHSAYTYTKNFNFSVTGGSYKMRYKARFGAGSGRYSIVGEYSSIPTYGYQTMSTSVSNLTSVPTLDQTLQIDIPTNITEITSKGIQVLSGENQYVRMERFDAGTNDILEVVGGNMSFGSTDTAYTTAYKIWPGQNDKHSLGDSSHRWANMWVNELNGTAIQFIASKSSSGYARLYDDVIVQWVRFTNKTNQFTGTWPTSFTAVYGAVVSKGNASSTYESATNAATVSYTTSNYYIDVNDSSRNGFVIAIGTKTV